MTGRWRRLTLAGIVSCWPAIAAGQTGPVPHRIVSASGEPILEMARVADDLARADVVVIAPMTEHPRAQGLVVETLRALARRRPEVALVLEALPRSVQEPLDHYLMRHMSDEEFEAEAGAEAGAAARPVLALAIEREWPVFAAGSTGGPTIGAGPAAVLAETVAAARAPGLPSGARPIVVVVVRGNVPSPAAADIPAVIRQRLAGARVIVVTIVSVGSLDSFAADDPIRSSDYLILAGTGE